MESLLSLYPYEELPVEELRDFCRSKGVKFVDITFPPLATSAFK